MTYSLKIFLPIHWDFSLQGVIQTRVYSMDFAELAVFIKCFSMSLNVTGVYNLVAHRSCSDCFNFFCLTSVILGYQGVFLSIFRLHNLEIPETPQSWGIANQMYPPSKLFFLFLPRLMAILSSSPWWCLRVSLLPLLLFASM